MPGRAIVLVGLRGAGKTTVGRALAELLGWTFDDGDEALAAAVGKPAGEWLAEVGEAAFREREQAVLLPLLASARDAVVATGGGAVLIPAVRQALAAADLFSVWLDAPVGVLLERARTSEVNRPPLTDHRPAAEWEHLHRVRQPFYAQVSKFVIDTSRRPPATCAEVIAKAYRRHSGS